MKFLRVENKKLPLSTVIKEIQKPLNDISVRFKEHVKSDNPVIQEMVDYVFNKRGKQIRPTLLFISSLIWSSKNYDDIIELGLSIELIHIATLVHDDVNDNSELRRGIETYNKKWGKTASVLFGDFLFSRAFVILSKLGSIAIIENLSRTTAKICEGEIIQSFFKKNYRITINDYLKIIELKTASLIAESCRVGALMSFKKDVKTQVQLYNFGLNLGMAFQVYDDYLDFVGNEKDLGKPTLNDILNGFITLPIIHAIDSTKKKDKNKNIIVEIEKARYDKNLGDIVKILNAEGSIEYAKEIARNYISRAKEEITTLKDKKLKALLLEIAEFVISRKF